MNAAGAGAQELDARVVAPDHPRRAIVDANVAADVRLDARGRDPVRAGEVRICVPLVEDLDVPEGQVVAGVVVNALLVGEATFLVLDGNAVGVSETAATRETYQLISTLTQSRTRAKYLPRVTPDGSRSDEFAGPGLTHQFGNELPVTCRMDVSGCATLFMKFSTLTSMARKSHVQRPGSQPGSARPAQHCSGFA